MKVEQQPKKRHHLLREIIETVALTALMFVIINLAVQNYDVQGPSMEPTLHSQERIMVDKVSYLFHPPARGDFIVFRAPPHPDENYVKRIIGIPGDTVVIHNETSAKGEVKTTVTINGTVLNETYVHPGYEGNVYGDMTQRVTTDHYFVMGDDRKNSSDSREWGLVPRANIIGRAALVYWPFGQDNSGFIPDASSVFAKVHSSTTRASSFSQGESPFVHTPIDESTALLALAPALLLLSARLRPRNHTRSEKQKLQYRHPSDDHSANEP